MTDHGAEQHGAEQHEAVFTSLRPLLFTIAYEITGSTADAEDVLQESYLRWAAVDLGSVDTPRSYLAAVVTRQSLNALRAASRRREDYVGPWLPEPLRLPDSYFTDSHLTDSDPESDVVLSESVSMAMLVVLESLGPDERAVFVLREVFGFSHAEIATAVGRSVEAVRQMSHRARSHVQSRRRRFQPGGDDVAEVTSAFLTATTTGDVQGLMDMLAPDAVLMSDGGGKVNAARRPIHGADHISRFLIGIARRGIDDPAFEAAVYNGSPAVIITSAGAVDSVFVLETVDGVISGVYVVRNPDKLATAVIGHSIAR